MAAFVGLTVALSWVPWWPIAGGHHIALGAYHLLGGTPLPLTVPPPTLLVVGFAFVLLTGVVGDELG